MKIGRRHFPTIAAAANGDERRKAEKEPKPWRTYVSGGTDTVGRRIEQIMSHFDEYIIYEAGGTLQLEGNTSPLDEAPGLNALLLKTMARTPPDAKRRRRV